MKNRTYLCSCIVLLVIAGIAYWLLVGPSVGNFISSVKSSPLKLYEGLPHQGYERELLLKEKELKATRDIGRYPFYEQPFAAEEADLARIREILSQRGTFKMWSGEKKCGGFHPDYAVVVVDGNSEKAALICFGCNELKLVDGSSEKRFDMNAPALKTVLQKYRVQRPTAQHGK